MSGEPFYRAFFEELNRLGYVEGQNLGVERYSGEGRTERYGELARDVVNTRPDLILAFGAVGYRWTLKGDDDNPDCNNDH